MEESEKELSQEELKAIEDAAYTAELTGTTVDVNTLADKQPAEDKQEPEPEPKLERVEVIPGYTKEELNEQLGMIPKLKKSLDSAHGTYGTKLEVLSSAIESLKTQRQEPTAAKLNPKNLKKITEGYGSDLAEALAEDFNGIIQTGGQSIDFERYQKEVDNIVNSRVADIELKFAEKRLKDKHNDYDKIAKFNQDENGLVRFADAKFGNWVANQSEEIQQIVLNSNDPDEISAVLDNYKSTLKQSDQNVDKKRVLERSVQPKGINTAAIGKSDKELEEEAYQAELRRGYT